jgi:hypothetical protein
VTEPKFTPQDFFPPHTPLAAEWIGTVRRTLERRDDVVRAYRVTTRYPQEDRESPIFQDELHRELVELPGDYGASREMFRDFEWVDAPLSSSLAWRFTPRRLMAKLREAGVLVWEREGS